MADRELVVLLFTDLVGSTELFQRLGEEQAEAFRRQHFGLLQRVIEARSGEVVKNLGDGLMVVFAAAADALGSAVSMQWAISEHNRSGAEPAVAIRVGLHAGEAVRDGSDYFGTPVIVAKRLCDAAAPGQILVSEVLVDLLGATAERPFRSLGRLGLKGLAEPVAAAEVEWDRSEGATDQRPAAPPSARAPGRVVRPPALTPPPDTFVGRDVEMGTLTGLMMRARLVTITGPGGVGKTRLSGHLVDAVAPRYPDGVWCCGLVSITADEQVSGAVATTLRVERRSGATVEERLVEFLSTKTALLVLDNCEHIIDGAASLSAAVLGGTAGVSVLATSREALGLPGEQRFALAPLSVPTGLKGPGVAPAVALFLQRTAAVNPAFRIDEDNRGAVYDLCRRLDGLPLAIELAAARMASHTIDEVVAEVADRLDQLSVRRGRAERHRSIGTVVEWSYDLLDEADRRLFERLSVFAGGWNADTAVIAGTGTERVSDQLDRLVEVSLVATRADRGVTRYTLLEPIRAYAGQRLRQRGDEAEARDAHARCYSALWAEAGPGLHGQDEGRWTARLDQELANLRAAHAWLVERGDVDAALRPAEHWFWYGPSSGVWEASRWAEQAANRFAASGHPLLPAAWAGAAGGAWAGGDLAGAATLADRGLTAAGDDAPARRLPLHITACVETMTGNFARAVELEREAAELSRVAGDDPMENLALVTAAVCLAYSGEAELACEMTERARAVAEANGNPSMLGWAYYGAGEVRLGVAPMEALPYLERSLEEAARASNRFILGVAGLSAVSLQARYGDPLAALRRYPNLMDHWQRAGAWTQQWITIRTLIETLSRVGAAEAATVLYGALGASPTASPVGGEDLARLSAVAECLQAELGDEAFAHHQTRGASLGDAGAVSYATEVLRDLLD